MAFRVKTMDQLKKKYPTATYIKDWDELKEWAKKNGESNSHILTVEIENGCGQLTYKGPYSYDPKAKWNKNVPRVDHYLSTHTFYGKGSYISYTRTLQVCGFNVILDNWDSKEE